MLMSIRVCLALSLVAAPAATGQTPGRACPTDTLGLGQWQPTTAGPGVLRMPLSGDRERNVLFAERQRFRAGYRSRPHVHNSVMHIVVICGSARIDFTYNRIPPGAAPCRPAGSS